MIHQLHNLPISQHFVLACSGGVDSMAVLDFYRRGGKNFTVAYFDHGTGNSEGALPVIKEYTDKHNLKLVVGNLSGTKPKDMSPEEFWRFERYRWLLSIGAGDVVTCHHLNDCVETYLFSSLHGSSKLIRSKSMMSCGEHAGFVVRPFLTTEKDELIKWCNIRNVKWYEDISNTNTHYPRNRVRHNILPECLKVNPGLFKVVKRKVLEMMASESISKT